MNRKHRSITSEQMFEHEMKDIIKAFEQKEGEDTWEAFSNHFVQLYNWILEDTITEYTKFMKYLTDLKEPIKNSLMTKRTILSGNATKFLESISLKIPEEKFESINQMFITTIINIFGANNKVQRDRMLNCYKKIIVNAKLPRMISKFSLLIINKKTRNNFDKMCILECLDTLIKVNNPDTIKMYHSEIENLITSSIASPQPESRVLTRSIFQSYKKTLPEEWAIFDESLTPQLKKTLNMPIPPAKKKLSSSSSSATLLLKKKKAQTTPSSSKTTPTITTSSSSSSSSATTETVNKNPLRKVARPTITKPLLKARTVAMKPQGQQKIVKKMTQKKVGASTSTSTSTTLKTKPRTNFSTTTAAATENNQDSAGHKQESESKVTEQENKQVTEQKNEKEREKEQEKELLKQNEITTTIDSSNIEEKETREKKDTEEEGELKLSAPVTANTESHKKKLDLVTPPSSQDSTSKLLRRSNQDTSSQPPTMTPSHSTPSKKEYPINNATLDSRPSCNTPEHPSKNIQSPTPSSSTSSPTILVSNRTKPIRKLTVSVNPPCTNIIKKPTKIIPRSSFPSTSSTSSSSASIKPDIERQRSSTGSISSTTSSTRSFPPSRFSTGSIASSKSISSRSSKIPLKRSSSTITAATAATAAIKSAVATTTTNSKRAMIQERTRLNIIKQKQKENIPPDAKRMKVGKEEEEQQTNTAVRPPSLFDQYRSGRLGISRSISPSSFKKPPI